jgi:AhpD family alkylhydroperoxidase
MAANEVTIFGLTSMQYFRLIFPFLLIGLVCQRHALAEDVAGPKPIPPTRPEAKQALDNLKSRTPRLPLPEPTDEEREQAESRSSFGLVNNGRMRALYLPNDLTGRNSGGVRQKDPVMSLDNAFGVELFWIASRVNNCHYCLGHQENKLLSAGVGEQRIAALDCDWSSFTPRDRAAFAFARKSTLRPDLIDQADVDSLATHFKPLECLEIVYLVSRYNSTNRWTDSLGIPQEKHRDFLTATPDQWKTTRSIVAPLEVEERPALPSREAAIGELAKCQARTPRLPLADESAAREIVPVDLVADPLPQWVRLLANFPVTGASAIETYALASTKGTLPEEVKAQIAWTAAREDRAWYALHLAAARLAKIGYSQDQMFALDRTDSGASDGPGRARNFARKLTSAPQYIEDADVAELKKSFSDQQVAEIVHQVGQAAFFNRLTEAALCAAPRD